MRTLEAVLLAWKTRLDRAVALFGSGSAAATAWGAVQLAGRGRCPLCGAAEAKHRRAPLTACPTRQPWETETGPDRWTAPAPWDGRV